MGDCLAISQAEQADAATTQKRGFVSQRKPQGRGESRASGDTLPSLDPPLWREGAEQLIRRDPGEAGHGGRGGAIEAEQPSGRPGKKRNPKPGGF